MPTLPAALSPLRHRDYRRLWGATLFSNFGGMVQAVGAAWAMTQMTSSATLIALVQASNVLPIMLFALIGGALADLYDRRRLMLIAQSAMMLASISLAFVALTGGLTPWILLSFTFLIGLGGAMHNPPWQASMQDLVPRKDLSEAVTLNSVGFNMMRSVGPAIGGLLTAMFGPAIAFVVNACSYVPLLITLGRWSPPVRKSEISHQPLGPALRDGLRYVTLSPNLMRVTLRAALFGLASVVILSLLPLIASSTPGGSPMLFGILMGCYGIGAILGAALNPQLRAHFSNETLVQLAFLAMAVAAWVLATAKPTWARGLALIPAGMGWVLALSLFNVTVQLSTPRWVVARALSFYQTAVFGGMAAGAWLWGSIASAYGWPTALTVAGVLLLIGALIGLKYPAPNFGHRDLDPAGRFQTPVLAIDIRGRSGPILVTVTYDVDPADTEKFILLMRERRQIRRRDGARDWRLLRDLEQPDRWSEAYNIATWDDYIRHNERRTKSDVGVTDALSALHRGEGRPRVHRMIERHNVGPADDVLLGKMPI